MKTDRRTRLAVFCCFGSMLVLGSSAMAASPQGTVNPLIAREGPTLASQAGISLTQAETDLQVQENAGDIVNQVQEKLGSSYGGLWFNTATGQFIINLAPAASQAAAESVTDHLGITAEAQFRHVTRTWTEVEAAAESARSALRSEIHAGQVAVSTDPRADSVEMQVVSGMPESTITTTQETLDNAIANSGIRGKIVTVPPSVLDAKATSCSFPYCDAPFRGGVKINSSAEPGGGSVYCTAGFSVEDIYGYKYTLTAGHCLTGYFGSHLWGSAFANGSGCGLGNPEAGAVNEYTDAGVIQAPGECGYNVGDIESDIVEWYSIPSLENYPVVSTPETAYVGMYDCHMGATSEEDCGEVEYANVARNIAYSSGTIEVHHLDVVCALSLPGDSGGPWQNGNLEWTYGSAIDVAGNSKSCSESGVSYGYELSYALSAMGVRLP